MTKKYAIPVDVLGVLDGHFGHCKLFEIITIEGGKVKKEEKVVPPPHEPGLLPKWLAEKGVTDILAGGMGHKAITIFNQNKINAFVGAPKMKAKELVEAHMSGSLQFTANYCDH